MKLPNWLIDDEFSTKDYAIGFAIIVVALVAINIILGLLA